jgi:hypothetical protein
MIIKFIKAFIKATHQERMDFFKWICKKARERFIDFWFGYVEVTRNYISTDEGEKLYTVSIIAGKHGKGQWFKPIDIASIKKILKHLNKNKKYFDLCIDLGCSAYQEYTFNKYQQKQLFKKLETMLSEEVIYIEDDELSN